MKGVGAQALWAVRFRGVPYPSVKGLRGMGHLALRGDGWRSVLRAFEGLQVGDSLFGAGTELDEFSGGFLAEGVVGHLEAEVVAQGLAIAFEKGPVEGGEGTGAGADGLLRIELAMAAEVGHAVDVGGAGDVWLGGGEAAVGVGGHAEDVGFDDPVVGIDVGKPKPVGEFSGREAAEVCEIREDHEASDVV